MTLTSRISLSLALTGKKAHYGSDVVDPLHIELSHQGAEVGSGNLAAYPGGALFRYTGSLSASAFVTFDFSDSSLTDPFGDSIAWNDIVMVYVHNRSTTITLGILDTFESVASSGAMFGVSGKEVVPGEVVLVSTGFNRTTGYSIGDGTLKVSNDGLSAATFDLVVVGGVNA